MEEILVFKTDANKQDLNGIKEVLDRTTGITSWSFDFDDCDNIFRLVSTGITKDEITEILSFHNIAATELTE